MKDKISMKNFLAAAALTLAAGTASAATYDYTNSQTNAAGPALSCASFGILNSSCGVTYNTAGLGVNGSPDTQPGQIDGSPILSGERLTFNFGYDVIWNSLTFGLWDRNDDAQLSWATGTKNWGPNVSNSVTLDGVTSSYLTVSAFGIPWRDGFVVGNDSFTVASIDVSAVPVPAAGWLLMLGLGSFAAMKRRRTAV